jgi:hypothetical protein
MRSPIRPIRRVVASPALALGGLAAFASAVVGCGAATSDIVLKSPRGAATANVTQTALQGPDVNVGVYGHEVRGWVNGKTVSVTLDEKHKAVTGLIGDRPVQLRVREDAGGVHTRGLFGGGISAFDVSPKAIEGTIGECSYSLVNAGESYQGSRSCGGGPEDVSVQLPSELDALPPAQKSLFVGLMLATS